MKKIFEKWWRHNTKSLSIINYKKAWKENGNKPRLAFWTNGAKKKAGDRCLDVTLIIGYTIFNYTNWDLQNEKYWKKGKPQSQPRETGKLIED